MLHTRQTARASLRAVAVVIVVAALLSACGSDAAPAASQRCATTLYKLSEVRQTFRSQGIELRVVPSDQIISTDPKHPEPIPGAVYLHQRYHADVSSVLFSTLQWAKTGQRRTATKDPILGFRIETLRCGNLVMLFRPRTRGEVIARRVVALLG